MPSNNPFRRFYEEGGYVSRKPENMRLKMALWASQNMADGGAVGVSEDESEPMPPELLAYGSQYFDKGGQAKGSGSWNLDALDAVWKSLPPEVRKAYKSGVEVLGEISPGAAVRDVLDASGELGRGILDFDWEKATLGGLGIPLAALGVIPSNRGIAKTAEILPGAGTGIIKSRDLGSLWNNALEYFGGLKRNPKPVQAVDAEGYPARTWYEDYVNKGTTYPWRPGEQWQMLRLKLEDEARRKEPKALTVDDLLDDGTAILSFGDYPVPYPSSRPVLPVAPKIDEARVRNAIWNYTGSDYERMSDHLRRFGENPADKLGWWDPSNYIGDRAEEVRYLAKWLQDQEYELPYDIYRSGRMRVADNFDEYGNLLPDYAASQVHGRGFGSFSFMPSMISGFGGDTYALGKDTSVQKIPFFMRIPQGTKVRGANVADHGYSANSGENEFIMAPFQGFDITDIDLLKHKPDAYTHDPAKAVNRLFLTGEPSGIYDPKSPRIYAEGGEVDDDYINDTLEALAALKRMRT